MNYKGIILRSINYKDSDKIIDIYTDKFGRISVLAKGIRKFKSSRKSHVDTLNHVAFSLVDSSKSFKILKEVTVLDTYRNSKLTLDDQINLYEFANIIFRSTQVEDINENIYQLLKESLDMYENSPELHVLIKAYFKLNLLSHLGFELDLNSLKNSSNATFQQGRPDMFKYKTLSSQELKLLHFLSKNFNIKFLDSPKIKNISFTKIEALINYYLRDMLEYRSSKAMSLYNSLSLDSFNK
jgi:DNA repair protein RecO